MDSIVIGAAILGALLGCSPVEPQGPDVSPPGMDVARATGNVVIVVIDTLRADRVGAYGQPLDTTPFIDSLAEEGIVFENARSNSSFTRQSMSAMYSGLYPSNGGQVGHWARPPEDRTVLPQYFKSKGYRTGYVSNQFIMPDFTTYFDVSENSPPPEPVEALWSGAEVSERALSIADGFGDDPYFLYVHYIDPHALYEPTEEYYERFQPHPIPKEQRLNHQIWIMGREHTVEAGIIPGHPLFDDMTLRYAAEIAMTDDYVRTLIEGLRERGQLENSTILVLSDHGEEFFEHRYIGHSWTLFEESIRVPLILWSPGLNRPARIAEPVSLVDVLPSLLDLHGIDYTAGEFDGRSWFKGEGPERVVAPESRPQIAELIYYEKTVQRAIVDGKYKFYGSSLWWDPRQRWEIDSSQHERAHAIVRRKAERPSLWNLTAKTMVFDLEADPRELTNLLEGSSDMLSRFQPVLRAYRERVTSAGVKDNPKDLASDLDPDTTERLKSLGYVQ
jgi:arylsulfatase